MIEHLSVAVLQFLTILRRTKLQSTLGKFREDMLMIENQSIKFGHMQLLRWMGNTLLVERKCQSYCQSVAKSIVAIKTQSRSISSGCSQSLIFLDVETASGPVARNYINQDRKSAINTHFKLTLTAAIYCMVARVVLKLTVKIQTVILRDPIIENEHKKPDNQLTVRRNTQH